MNILVRVAGYLVLAALATLLAVALWIALQLLRLVAAELDKGNCWVGAAVAFALSLALVLTTRKG